MPKFTDNSGFTDNQTGNNPLNAGNNPLNAENNPLNAENGVLQSNSVLQSTSGNVGNSRSANGAFTTRRIAAAGFLAALYAVLTIFLPVPQYGGIQFRAAEAFTVLPFLFPEAIWGLTVGCFIANLYSPFMLDCVFGTAATLLAALWTSRVKKSWFAPLPPVVCNAVMIGAEIAWFAAGEGENFLFAWAWNALTVGLGEAVACYGLGLLLLKAIRNSKFAETIRK